MTVFAQIQNWIVLGLTAVALGIEIYAFADCVRRRPDAFTAAGKRTKGFWVAITLVAAFVGLASFGRGLGFLAVIAIVAAGVYLADVKPALDQVTGKGGSRMGPYGPW